MNCLTSSELVSSLGRAGHAYRRCLLTDGDVGRIVEIDCTEARIQEIFDRPIEDARGIHSGCCTLMKELMVTRSEFYQGILLFMRPR